jgi:formate hydrogenlyase subunit 4
VAHSLEHLDEVLEGREMWGILAAPIAGLIGALLAAWVALRNARKSPHENLKALADIRSALASDLEHVDPQQALSRAIRFEVRKLDKLTEARERGIVPFVGEVLRQRSTVLMGVWLVLLIIVGLSLFSYASYLEIGNAYAYQANQPTKDTLPWYLAVAACCGLLMLSLFAWGLAAFLRWSNRRAKRRKASPQKVAG